MRIALRICINDCGTRQSISSLLKLLDEHQVSASFAISFGNGARFHKESALAAAFSWLKADEGVPESEPEVRFWR